MVFDFLPLNEIDLNDRTFEIRKFGPADRLSASLERFGIMEPPWVVKRGGSYVPVDGFKRLRWAATRGSNGTVCRILPENLSLRELWGLRIEKKLFEPDLDLAEKARIVSVLLDIFPPAEVPRPFLNAMNIPPRSDVLTSWAGLAGEEEDILEMLASGDIAERAALEVAGWDRASRVAVLKVLQSLRCSASIQVELVERINEIAIREGSDRIGILNSPQVREILSSKDFNHRQKTQALRDLLIHLRFPRLSEREGRFREVLRALELPGPVRIVPPAAFEGTAWRMELTFSGPEELRGVLKSAGTLADSKRLDALFEINRRGSESKGRR